MNRLLAFRGELEADGTLRLPPDDPRALHLAATRRPAPGDRLRAGVVNGWRAEAEVLAGGAAGWTLRLAPVAAPAPPARWTLLLALPRPQTLRKVLLAAPQLGVARLLLVGAARTEKSYFHSPLLSEGEWRRQLLAGLAQAGGVRLPEVLLFERLHRLLEEGLERWLPAAGPRLLPHPGAAAGPESLAGEPLPAAALAVGPEGGWREGELAAFAARGFRPVDLGPRILRVETAVDCLCAQLELLARWSSERTPAR